MWRVPALRALRAAFGGDRLALAAPRWLAPLVDLVGGIDEQIDVGGLGPYRWPPPAPGWAVNLHGRGPQSHRLLRTAQPRHLIAYACAEAGHHVGPVWRPDEHEVHRWCRLLDCHGIATDPDDLALHRPPPGDLPVGVGIVHPGRSGGRSGGVCATGAGRCGRMACAPARFRSSPSRRAVGATSWPKRTLVAVRGRSGEGDCEVAGCGT